MPATRSTRPAPKRATPYAVNPEAALESVFSVLQLERLGSLSVKPEAQCFVQQLKTKALIQKFKRLMACPSWLNDLHILLDYHEAAKAMGLGYTAMLDVFMFDKDPQDRFEFFTNELPGGLVGDYFSPSDYQALFKSPVFRKRSKLLKQFAAVLQLAKLPSHCFVSVLLGDEPSEKLVCLSVVYSPLKTEGYQDEAITKQLHNSFDARMNLALLAAYYPLERAQDYALLAQAKLLEILETSMTTADFCEGLNKERRDFRKQQVQDKIFHGSHENIKAMLGPQSEEQFLVFDENHTDVVFPAHQDGDGTDTITAFFQAPTPEKTDSPALSECSAAETLAEKTPTEPKTVFHGFGGLPIC
jgi:hypothetical protein